MKYRPLPEYLTIENSPIQGLGLFVKESINQGVMIGKIHIPDPYQEGEYIRTPLGGFGNHSDDPNCSKVLMEDGSWWIFANRDIVGGEELTWSYTLYEIT